MAVTSIWPITGNPDGVIEYAINPEKTSEESREETAALHAIDNVVEYTADDLKTEKRMYVSGVNCQIPHAKEQFMETKRCFGKMDGRTCYHGYQSFRAGEVDADTAHRIGVALAKELWGDRFEVVVATHLNTDHYHNHFVINSVSRVDGKKFSNRKPDYARMREVSDRLCKEHHLSVIKDPQWNGKSYVPLFTHIKYMLLTTMPSLIIALIVYAIVGFSGSSVEATDTAFIQQSLSSTYNITPWLLLVPIATGLLIWRKLPAIVTLFSSVILASIALVIAQPDVIAHISGDGVNLFSTFKAIILATTSDVAVDTGNPTINELVATSGMGGMMDTIWLIICAMCFGGVMYGSGMLDAISRAFLRIARRTVSVVASTVSSGIFFNLCTGDQYISIILTSKLFNKLYDERGLERRLLSRSVEDSATVTSVLVPWNSCGMTQSTVLGVATITYLPYCIFNIVSPLMSILVAAIGYKIFKRTGDEA